MPQLPAVVSFQSVELAVHDRDGVPFLSAADLARSLGYADARLVSRLYSRHKSEFTDSMTAVVEVSTSDTSANLTTQTRIFSPRGCHLVAMFARTPVAAEFRRWVLDVLDGLQSYAQATPAIDHDALRTAERQAFITAAAVGMACEREMFKAILNGNSHLRVLAWITHDDKADAKAVAPDAVCMSFAKMAHAIEHDGLAAGATTADLLALIHALTVRLQQRESSRLRIEAQRRAA